EPPARPAEGLVRCGGDHVRVRHRRRVGTGCHQSRKVGHVHHEYGLHVACSTGEPFVVTHAGVGTVAGHDHAGPVLARQLLHTVVIDDAVVIHAVVHGIVEDT